MKISWKRAFSEDSAVRLILGMSGFVAVAIAVTILLAPETFYTAYGIPVGGNQTLTNELKAPAGALLVAGLWMFAGIFRRHLVVVSLITATTVYLSYGLSRVMSIVLDGMPNQGMVSAAATELLIGAVCLLTLGYERKKKRDKRVNAPGRWNDNGREVA